ncbi:MAG: hypothetical protein AB1551_05850 [Actinomycetota bacterium]
MPSKDPAERSLISRIGAHSLHATHDSRELTAPARSAFLRKFEDQVDPDRKLSEAERARRAAHAKKAYFTRLAYLSARARSRRRVGTP